jgi:lipopolysaccharide export system protein LptA
MLISLSARLAYCLVIAATLLSISAVPLAAQTTAANAAVNPSVGRIEISATSNTICASYILYSHAEMTSADGTTSVDADEVRADLSKTSSIVKAVAHGHVRATMLQNGRTVILTADKAVYDPKSRAIALTGNVKASSDLATGSVVQTADSGTIQLGAGADFPRLVMQDHVHAIFTPKQ